MNTKTNPVELKSVQTMKRLAEYKIGHAVKRQRGMLKDVAEAANRGLSYLSDDTVPFDREKHLPMLKSTIALLQSQLQRAEENLAEIREEGKLYDAMAELEYAALNPTEEKSDAHPDSV